MGFSNFCQVILGVTKEGCNRFWRQHTFLDFQFYILLDFQLLALISCFQLILLQVSVLIIDCKKWFLLWLGPNISFQMINQSLGGWNLLYFLLQLVIVLNYSTCLLKFNEFFGWENWKQVWFVIFYQWWKI